MPASEGVLTDGDIEQLTSADGTVVLNPADGRGPVVDLSAAGGGGGISIEDEGVPVAGSPVATVNWVGVGVVAQIAAGVGVIRIDGAAVGNAPAFDVAPDNVASAGAGATAARSDHVHAAPAGVPVTIGAANAEGTANTFARSDHVHEHFPGGPVQAFEFAEETVTTTKGGGGFADIAGMNLTVGTDGVYAVTFNAGFDIPGGHDFHIRLVVNGVQVVGTERQLSDGGEWTAGIAAIVQGLVATDTVAVQWIRIVGAGLGECDERTFSIVQVLQ